MTVKELIERLQKADPEALVVCAGTEVVTVTECRSDRDDDGYWFRVADDEPVSSRTVWVD
jgi:hypothetical protein